MKTSEEIRREEIIKELESLNIVCIHPPNYEEMSTRILEIRLKIFKSMLDKSDDYFE